VHEALLFLCRCSARAHTGAPGFEGRQLQNRNRIKNYEIIHELRAFASHLRLNNASCAVILCLKFMWPISLGRSAGNRI